MEKVQLSTAQTVGNCQEQDAKSCVDLLKWLLGAVTKVDLHFYTTDKIPQNTDNEQ